MSTTSSISFNGTAIPAGKSLRISMWAAQVVTAGLFCMSGFMKAATPVAELSAMMPWTGQVSPSFLHFIAFVDFAGGLGLLLPSLTRIQPRLTVLAALGCVVLQILAMAFHASRGEFSVLPLNVVLLTLSAFILWGRSTRAPIAPR